MKKKRGGGMQELSGGDVGERGGGESHQPPLRPRTDVDTEGSTSQMPPLPQSVL